MQLKLKFSTKLINNTYSNKKQTDNNQNTSYFTKTCFDGCQFASYLYLQQNGMQKDKKTLNLALLPLMFIQ